MKYLVTHRTMYQYTEPVSVCHNLVRLAPRHLPYQVPGSYELQVAPEPASRTRRLDYFGNQLDYFSIQQAHRELVIEAKSAIAVTTLAFPGRASPCWQEVREQLSAGRDAQTLEAYHFSLPTARVPLLPGLRDYAEESFRANRPILDAVEDLVSRIHSDFSFDPQATTVHASTIDLLSLRRGVCQDFAHFAIGCVRAMGLAARYVSGYLRTIPPSGSLRLTGADASHAWLSVFAGPDGWVDFDPTNNLRVQSDHITIAWGRDYDDVCPIQGVFVGGGQHVMHVAVDVVPMESDLSSPPHSE